MSRYKAYPEYKDSGVEWLGLVPQHWNSRQLKFLCTCNDDVLAESMPPEYEIEYIDIGSVSASEGISKTETMLFSGAPSRARRVVRDGDVIISTVRTYLEAIASIDNPPPNLVVSTGFAVIRPNQHLHKKFAAYCLRTSGFIKEVIARSVGVSYPAINASDLINIKAPLPKFGEQEKIANFLDHETAKIDTLIAKQQELIKLLKEKRQAVISHAVTKGLNPNAPMRDSGVEWLGEVPAHWDVVPLKHLCSLLKDGTHLPPPRVDIGIPLLSVRNIIDGKFVLREDDSNISKTEYLKLCKSFVPKQGDVVLAIVGGTIGKVAIINKMPEFHVQRSVAVFRVNEHLMTHESLANVFGSSNFQSLLWGNVGFSAQPGIYLGTLANFSLPVPPIYEQIEINKYCGSKVRHIDILIERAAGTVELMQERRTALISAAVTGKIDVRDWQPPVSEAQAA